MSLSEQTMEYTNYREMKGWSTLFSPRRKEVALFEKELGSYVSQPKIVVLDFGFGSGALLQWARTQHAEVLGVEVQEDLLHAAAQCGIPVHRDLTTVADGSVDVLTCFDVLEHLTNDELKQWLREARRVLKRTGYLIVRFPNCQSPAGLIDQFGDYTHKAMLSGPIVATHLKMSGFQVVELREARGEGDCAVTAIEKLAILAKSLLRTVGRLWYRITFGAGGALLSANILIIARVA